MLTVLASRFTHVIEVGSWARSVTPGLGVTGVKGVKGAKPGTTNRSTTRVTGSESNGGVCLMVGGATRGDLS